jgi:hypothetical protein
VYFCVSCDVLDDIVKRSRCFKRFGVFINVEYGKID